MRIVTTKSEAVFELEDLMKTNEMTIHAQHIVPYPAISRAQEASMELMEQAKQLDSTYDVFENVGGIQRGQGKTKLKENGLPGRGCQRKHFSQVRADVPGLVEDYLHTAGDQDHCIEIVILVNTPYSKRVHGEL